MLRFFPFLPPFQCLPRDALYATAQRLIEIANGDGRKGHVAGEHLLGAGRDDDGRGVPLDVNVRDEEPRQYDDQNKRNAEEDTVQGIEKEQIKRVQAVNTHTHRSGMVMRSSAMYLSPCNELFCRKYLMLFLAASRLQSDTSSSLECSSLPCRLLCIAPWSCFLFGACLRVLRGPSPWDFMLQLAKLARHAGAIYTERGQLQLIRIESGI